MGMTAKGGKAMSGDQLAGRHAVITGAGAGIGREAALLFAEGRREEARNDA